eukprot:980698_1
MNYMHIKVAHREGFNPTEDIHIYLYGTKGTIAEMTQFLHQNTQRNMGINFWACSTWSMRALRIFATSQTSTRSFGWVDIHEIYIQWFKWNFCTLYCKRTSKGTTIRFILMGGMLLKSCKSNAKIWVGKNIKKKR